MPPKAQKKPAEPAARSLDAKVRFALSDFSSQSCLRGLRRNSIVALH